MLRIAALAVVSLWFAATAPDVRGDLFGQECFDKYPGWITRQRIEFEECMYQMNNAIAGNYFCYVEHVAGIQFDEKNKSPGGSPYVGRIRLPSDKFTFKVTTVKMVEEKCTGGSAKCEPAQYKYRFESETAKIAPGLMLSDTAHTFSAPGGMFTLMNRGGFWSVLFGDSGYVSNGRCEKIN